MFDDVLKRGQKYCKNCRYSTISGKKMYCLKNHLNRTFVYETCDKYDKPEEVFRDVQVWKYFSMT